MSIFATTGTFLVRFGARAGTYTVCFVDTTGRLCHTRIEQVPLALRKYSNVDDDDKENDDDDDDDVDSKPIQYRFVAVDDRVRTTASSVIFVFCKTHF